MKSKSTPEQMPLYKDISRFSNTLSRIVQVSVVLGLVPKKTTGTVVPNPRRCY
ncbi:hypothetical protein L0P88_17900 [Muricauda sp. SCSIO 64092]|uniref:hypothetical protein n=1 Tax=Allomuricauda sp. SCSIO 64092 TaxID=2908842 RepID=UPI001FF63F66|nr:hypothetical protein [Muricauda sp. SCSIO 64092]UOY05801.1 hypothetical protein L0P88_17900 [Muricauda sp. SCSIO 64092]